MKLVLLDLSRVDATALCGVQLVSGHRAVAKFGSAAVYQDFAERYDGRSFLLLEGGGSVEMSDRCSETTYVAVHGAAIEFPEALLRRHFTYKAGLEYPNECCLLREVESVPNGTRTLELVHACMYTHCQ